MTTLDSDTDEELKAHRQGLVDSQAALEDNLSSENQAKSSVINAQQLHIINQFAKDLIRLSSKNELIWYVVNEVVGQVGFVDCVIYLLSDDQNTLIQSAAFGAKSNENNEIINALEIPCGSGITGHVANTGEAIIITDTSQDARYIPDLNSMSSEICIPIIDGDRLFGVLDCEHPEKGHFNENHLELLTTITTMLASRLTQWEVHKKLANTQGELTESEEKYRRLFELSEDPMMLLTDNKFELCNDAAARVFKYSNHAEMENIHPSDISPPTQPDGQSSFEKAEKMMQRAIEKGFHRFEWIHRKKTKEDFPMEVTLTKIPYKGKAALYAVCRDITIRKRMDVALHQAVKKANDANESKSEFLANMSHELRTPLNAIIGFSQMMTEKIFGPLGSEKYESYADNILNSAEYLSNMINDILDLSAITSSNNQPDRSELNIEELVGECIAMMNKLASDDGIDLAYEIQIGDEPVFADKKELKQVIVNLLANAIKFTPEGGSISLSVYEEDNHHVFKITDTGCGIPSDKLDTLTDRFDRGELDPFEAVEGTGLGLAIVKSLIELHHGTLKISSIVDKGTSVTFTIPFKAYIPMEGMAQIELEF